MHAWFLFMYECVMIHLRVYINAYLSKLYACTHTYVCIMYMCVSVFMHVFGCIGVFVCLVAYLSTHDSNANYSAMVVRIKTRGKYGPLSGALPFFPFFFLVSVGIPDSSMEAPLRL